MRYTAGQAAKATGKSVPTITRAIQKGQISAEKVQGGGYLIDAAELHRVFPPVTVKEVSNPNTLGHETPHSNSVLQVELEAMRERLRLLEGERERERSQLLDEIRDLRGRLDAEGEERRKLVALLTYKPESPPAAPRKPVGGFWARLWGMSGAND